MVEAHPNGLAELKIDARDLAHRCFHLADEIIFRHGWIRPQRSRLEYHDIFRDTGRMRFGGDFRGADACENGFHLRKSLLEHLLQNGLNLDGLSQSGARYAHGMHSHIALIETGDELASHAVSQQCAQGNHHHCREQHQHSILECVLQQGM